MSSPLLTPKIAGPWQLLYRPEKTGCYVNDHTLFQALDGTWHLIGITRDEPEVKPDGERWFTHGFGPHLISETGLKEHGIVCDNGVRAWAPCVVSDGRRYYMYFGPSPLRFATSDELTHWMENPITLQDCPLDACHRDSMVLKRTDGTWLMYATGLKDGYGVISVFESKDLIHWRFVKYALRTSGQAPLRCPWGATESPFVVFIDGCYYLFITYTNCSLESYHNTLVFRSIDPLDFGEYTGDNEAEIVIAKLQAHAPEIVQDSDGTWYITSCGWRGFNTPIEGGVAIAKLEWS
jgi:beta-fructofuranosidase